MKGKILLKKLLCVFFELYEYDIPEITSFQVPVREIPYQRSPYVTCLNGNLYLNEFRIPELMMYRVLLNQLFLLSLR